MLSRFAKLALVAGLLAAFAGVTAGPAAAQDEEPIAAVAAADGRFTTLLTALDAAGLAETFSSCDDGSEFTVLAPTDDAFAAALADLELDPAALLADTELLTTVLTYHVVEGAVDSATVATLDGASAPTLQGEEITVAVDGENISIGSGAPTPANVVVADVPACNGIIHAIDYVLLPPSVADALGLGAAEEEAPAEEEEEAAAEEEAAPAEEEELAETGVSSDLLAVIALAMLAGGAMVFLTSRRTALD
jgi:uncharacterized surface protein with fasciclin (FAS1) repeats